MTMPVTTTGAIHAILNGERADFSVEIGDDSVVIQTAGSMRFCVSAINSKQRGVDLAMELSRVLAFTAGRHGPVQGRGEVTTGRA
jgi:hypothetical protein